MEQVEIHIIGQIDEQWSDWFEGLKITHPNCNATVLTGQLRDQAALYGLIARLRDLGLSLRLVSYGEQRIVQE